MLHIHRPDPQTPLEEQAAGLDAIYKQGSFAAVKFPYSLIILPILTFDFLARGFQFLASNTQGLPCRL